VSNATASALRRWLRRTPQPTKIRLDGEKVVAVAQGANQWAVTEETVLALNPSRIEALDSTGLVLRALNLRDEEDDEPAKKTPVAEDRFNQFARLLNEAHAAGATQHAEAYTKAFDYMVRLVDTFAQRLTGLEKAWSQAITQSAQAQAEAVLARGEGNGDPAGAAIAAMIAAQAARAGVNVNVNGKAAKKEG